MCVFDRLLSDVGLSPDDLNQGVENIFTDDDEVRSNESILGIASDDVCRLYVIKKRIELEIDKVLNEIDLIKSSIDVPGLITEELSPLLKKHLELASLLALTEELIIHIVTKDFNLWHTKERVSIRNNFSVAVVTKPNQGFTFLTIAGLQDID